jgi:hypothetical protein
MCSEGGESRLTVAVCSKEGGVKVNGRSTAMTKSLRKRPAVARSEARVKVVACSGVRDEMVTA